MSASDLQPGSGTDDPRSPHGFVGADLSDPEVPLGREEEPGGYAFLGRGRAWNAALWLLLALFIGGWASLVWVYVRDRPPLEKVLAWIVSIAQMGLIFYAYWSLAGVPTW